MRTAVILLLVGCAVGTRAPAEVQRETVYVPMQDGISLATDIYRDGPTESAPVVQVRTPYNKAVHPPGGTAERFAKAGYVVAIQDCRGAHASEGVMVPYNNEGQDGFDCIEWIIRQPWCNGRVGMWGASNTGAVQWQAAVEKPPGLVAITPRATWSSFHGNLHIGGAVRLSLIGKWASGRWKRPADALPLDQIDWDGIMFPLYDRNPNTGAGPFDARTAVATEVVCKTPQPVVGSVAKSG
jgi:predicted acyl esterase